MILPTDEAIGVDVSEDEPLGATPEEVTALEPIVPAESISDPGI